jgi:S-ribosylhomocysteine lyase LuxS involved in autoinducer biosynthesis
VAERRSFLCRDDTDFAAASRDLVPQLAKALREACEWVADLAYDDNEPGTMCNRCGATNGHYDDCPKELARAFLARDVEVTDDDI